MIGKHADFIDLMRRKVPIPIPSRIPKYVQNLIKNCCNYTPSHRIDSVTLQTQLEYLKNKL